MGWGVIYHDKNGGSEFFIGVDKGGGCVMKNGEGALLGACESEMPTRESLQCRPFIASLYNGSIGISDLSVLLRQWKKVISSNQLILFVI